MLSRLPPVIKALLAVNVAVFLLQLVVPHGVQDLFVLWPLFDDRPYGGDGDGLFEVWQLLTYGFMHGSPEHLVFNMLALVMFGTQLAYTWRTRRFLVFYLVCIVGAGLCQLAVGTWIASDGGKIIRTVGASGGIFGILLAYGLLFPNRRIMPLVPIAMRARTVVLVFGVVELVLGITGTQSGVAHFAHLGGMLFGWLLLRQWNEVPPFGGNRHRRI